MYSVETGGLASPKDDLKADRGHPFTPNTSFQRYYDSSVLSEVVPLALWASSLRFPHPHIEHKALTFNRTRGLFMWKLQYRALVVICFDP